MLKVLSNTDFPSDVIGEPRILFEQSSYVVSESQTSVEFCVTVDSAVSPGTTISASYSTMDQSAQGRGIYFGNSFHNDYS